MLTSSYCKALVLGLVFIPYTYAASAWVGCITATSAMSVASAKSHKGSSAECISSCASAGYDYASYVSLVVVGNNCYCIAEKSYPGSLAYIADSAATSSGCLITEGTTFAVSTTYSYSGCYDSLSLSTSVVTVSSPRACFTHCASTTAAYFMPNLLTTGSTYSCACGSIGALSIPSIDCGLGQYYSYSHPAAAAVSALPRRKREAARAMAKKQAQMIKERAWDCPRGMKACNIQGIDDSWECVDPYRDLESCGGCAHGDYIHGTNGTDPTGVDCTAVPGILRGSVTCSDGHCVAFACKRGWTLRDGECIRSMTIQVRSGSRL